MVGRNKGVKSIDQKIEAAKEREKELVAQVRAREREKIAKLKAKRQAAEARARIAERKLDTRRKIMLGGALIGQARAGNPLVKDCLAALLAGFSDREKLLFEGWTP